VTRNEPNVAIALLVALPGLPVAAAAGSFFGLHADGLVPATFLAPVVYRLLVAWIVRSMSSQPAKERPDRPLWRLNVLNLLLIYPAATVVGVWVSGMVFGLGFPSSWGRAWFAIGVTLVLSFASEVVATLCPRSKIAVRIAAGITISMPLGLLGWLHC
jgi:hypothetical protein